MSNMKRKLIDTTAATVDAIKQKRPIKDDVTGINVIEKEKKILPAGGFTTVQIFRPVNGQIQVSGLRPGQQLLQRPDGKLQICSTIQNSTLPTPSGNNPSASIASTSGKDEGIYITKSNEQIDLLQEREKTLILVLEEERKKLAEVNRAKDLLDSQRVQSLKPLLQQIQNMKDKKCVNYQTKAALKDEIRRIQDKMKYIDAEDRNLDVHLEQLNKLRIEREKASVDLLEKNNKEKTELQNKVVSMEVDLKKIRDERNPNTKIKELLVKMIDEKEKRLECPVCLEVPMADIYRCREEHMICEKCFNQAKKKFAPNRLLCGQCRTPYSDPPEKFRSADEKREELFKLRRQLQQL